MNERGFTLAELLIACAVIGMVMAGVFTLQQQGQIAYLWGAGRVEVQQNARLALDIMTRELRSAQSVSYCGNYITFVDSSGTTMSYQLSGGTAPYTLTRTVTATTTDVIGGVQSLTISCLKTDGYTVTSSTSEQPYTIELELRTRPEQNLAAGSPGAQQAVMKSRIKLRNL